VTRTHWCSRCAGTPPSGSRSFRWRAWAPGAGGAAEPDFDEDLGTSNLANAEFDSPIIRLSYTSFLTPPRVYDYVLATGELALRKETEVRGDYRPERYLAERQWAPAADGTLIPPRSSGGPTW
jgi:oligopeptidase B